MTAAHRLKVVIPGGSGQVGAVLARAFHADGYEVVVLSRGRLVAQTTLAELVARTSVIRVRTPDASRLLQVLAAAGLQVRLVDGSTVEARSATADAVGVAAAAAGVTILELSRHDENLESLFFDLVHQNQETAA